MSLWTDLFSHVVCGYELTFLVKLLHALLELPLDLEVIHHACGCKYLVEVQCTLLDALYCI